MTFAKVSMIATICAAGLFTTTARAAAGPGSGWYAGADLGRMEYKFDNGFDASDNAFGVHGGYRFGRHVAIEAGYADLGSYKSTEECPSDFCTPEQYPIYYEVSSQRLELALLGILPLAERMEAYAKVGVVSTEFDLSTRTQLVSSSDSTRSSDPIYGIGLRLNFDAPWSLRLQWERTPDINDSGADLNAAWLGAEYRFGG